MAYTSFQQNADINVNLKEARVFLGHTYIYTHLSFGERHFMRCTYFHLQRIFLCYMQNYPTYIFCKAPSYLSKHTHIFAKHFCPLSTRHTYLQGILLPIYSIWTTFLLYVHILFTYMVIHLRGSFMLCTFTHIYTHLQFQVTHSSERQFLYY